MRRQQEAFECPPVGSKSSDANRAVRRNQNHVIAIAKVEQFALIFFLNGDYRLISLVQDSIGDEAGEGAALGDSNGWESSSAVKLLEIRLMPLEDTLGITFAQFL